MRGAIGAIGDWESSIELIEAFCADDAPKCQRRAPFAPERLKRMKSGSSPASMGEDAAFGTTDPAPAFEEEKSPSALGDILCDRSKPLFVRYRAMFFRCATFRRRASVLALNRALDEIDPADDSDLFRHEVAYVLGKWSTAPQRVP